MKKIISIILAFLIVCFLLTGCGKSNGSKAFSSDRFEVVEYISGIRYDEEILYDRETGVMYIWIIGTYKGGLSPLYNSDGTVMIYEGQ